MSSANPDDNVHIDVHNLTRSNREGLSPGANTLALAILNIENKHLATAMLIVAVTVRCNPSDPVWSGLLSR